MTKNNFNKNPQINAPITVKSWRENMIYNIPLKLRRKEEQYDEFKMNKEANIKTTRPNFGNTINKLVNKDSEEVEELQNWQHKNIKQNYPDPNFKKTILNPIEKSCKQNWEFLLKDPIFKKSNIIKDPAKLAEGFNRSNAEYDKKSNTKGNAKNESLYNTASYSLRQLKTPASVSRLDILSSPQTSLYTPSSGRRKLDEIDYQNLGDEKELEIMRERNVTIEVELQYK